MFIVITSPLRAFFTACFLTAVVFGTGVGVGITLEREKLT